MNAELEVALASPSGLTLADVSVLSGTELADMVRFVAWSLVVLATLVGWGLVGARVVSSIGGVELRSAGEILPLGVALYVAVAGLAVAFDAHGRLFVGFVVATGIAAAFFEAGRWLRRGGRLEAPRLVVGALLLGAVLLLALSTTAHFAWNLCDDDVAYLYLADRLVLEGDLLDPLNFRRLTSLAGLSTLQALFLVRLPESFLPFADVFLGSLLIVVGLWRTRAGRWSIWGIAAALLVLLYPLNLGAVNTSPILLPVGLTLAAFSISVRLRAEASTRRAELMLSGVVGLLVGAAATLRPQFALPLCMLAVAAVLWPRLDLGTATRLVGLGLGLAGALGGLAVASWRAVGTPMFPLFGGNVDQAWLEQGPQNEDSSISDVLGRVAETRAVWACGLAFVLGVRVVYLARDHSHDDRAWSRWSIRLLSVATVSAMLWLAVVVGIWGYLGDAENYARFWAPVSLAAVLLPFVLVNRSTGLNRWTGHVLGLAGLALVAYVLHVEPGDLWKRASEAVQGTGSGYVAELLAADRYSKERGSYDGVAERLPAGAKVLTAVDLPSLLLDRGLEIHTLDVAGSTSPRPHMPFFVGTQAKLSWLRRNGYEYVVAFDPARSACLYNRSHHREVVAEDGPEAAWARYFLDWLRFVDARSRTEARVVELGPLVVLEV